MKKIYLLLALILSIVSLSCDKDTNQEITEDYKIADLVKVVDLQTRIRNFDGNGVNANRGPCALIIVDWDEWGRKSRNCDSWGLCNATWFEWDCSRNSQTAAPLDFDTVSNEYFIDILFAQPIPPNVPVEEFSLAIDEAFQVWVGAEIQQNLTFNEGLYDYNPTLGDFGGIRIYLD